MVAPQTKFSFTCVAPCWNTWFMTRLPKKGRGLLLVDELKEDSKAGYAPPPVNSCSALCSLLLIHSANVAACWGCFVFLNTAVVDPTQSPSTFPPACHCGREATRQFA